MSCDGCTLLSKEKGKEIVCNVNGEVKGREGMKGKLGA